MAALYNPGMIRVQESLRQALSQVLERLAPGHDSLAVFEKPKLAAHGDLAITAAMQLARPLKQNPRQLAQQLMEQLLAHPVLTQWVNAIEMAGPGFLNLRRTWRGDLGRRLGFRAGAGNHEQDGERREAEANEVGFHCWTRRVSR